MLQVLAERIVCYELAPHAARSFPPFSPQLFLRVLATLLAVVLVGPGFFDVFYRTQCAHAMLY